MSSPFSLFRRHQRVLMVVITGLSMISFVLLGAVQDPRQLPTPLVVIFLAAMAGGIAWLAGLNSGKGAEWGLTGALVGTILGIGAVFYNREASAVLIDNGNLSAQQVSELQRQRYVVNRFVGVAFQQTFSMPLQSLPAPLQRNYLFGFSNADEVSVDDVVVGELLRREAERMGIVVSDKVVIDFIKQVTSKAGLVESFERSRGQMNPQEAAMWDFYLPQIKEKPLTSQAFTRLRQSLQISESGLMNAIRNELQIRQAYQLLAGSNYFPPEQFWGYYQKLNVKQSAEVASVPVKDFIDPAAKPSDSDLVKLFDQYRQNLPGYSPEGRPEPGRPGFYQPRRFQLGYLEADYEQIEPLMGEVTDEEIQKAYADRYLKEVPAEGMPAVDLLDGPDLPPAPSTDKPAGDKPATDKPDTEKPAADKPAAGQPGADKPATEQPVEKSAAETPSAMPAKGTSAVETAVPEKTPVEKPAGKTTESPQPAPVLETKPEVVPQGESNSSSLLRTRATQPVAFLDADAAAPAEKPADGEAAKPAEKPASETPAAEKPESPQPAIKEPVAEKPAAEKPAGETTEPSKPASEKPVSETAIPPAPSSDLPVPPTAAILPLDDALKAELRAEILKERTQVAIQKRVDAAQIEMSRISDDMQREKTEERYLTLEEATEQLKLYAAQHQLVYVVTPPLTYVELADSEEYPIGQAALPQRMTVADAMFRSMPTDLYRVNFASDFTSSSSYVFWKLEDKAGYAPATLDDEPGLRAQVTEAWNLEQARPKAQARAEELAKMVRESNQPMGTVLAEQTVTGTENSLFIPVRITGDFTWMQKPMVPPTGMQQQMPVRPSLIPGVTDAGEEFFTKVFDDIKVGEIGIAPNNDHTVYYVVKVESRDPSTPEQLEALQKKFLSEGMQAGGYSSMLQQSLSENSINWLQQLFDEHEVVILQRN